MTKIKTKTTDDKKIKEKPSKGGKVEKSPIANQKKEKKLKKTANILAVKEDPPKSIKEEVEKSDQGISKDKVSPKKQNKKLKKLKKTTTNGTPAQEAQSKTVAVVQKVQITDEEKAEKKKAKKLKQKQQKAAKKTNEKTVQDNSPKKSKTQTETPAKNLEKKPKTKTETPAKNLEKKSKAKTETPAKNLEKKSKIKTETPAKNLENLSAKDIEKIQKKKEKKLKQKEKKNQRKALASEAKKVQEAQVTSTTPPVEVEKPNLAERRSRDANAENATVFVGNLPTNTKRIQVVRLFEDYKPVQSVRFRTAHGRVIFKHKARKEAGSLNAYVKLKDAQTAEAALALNGKDFKGIHLRVTPADRQTSDYDPKRTILVGNLKYSATEEQMRDIFSSCGEIDYVRCLRDEKGCKGVAYVCFIAPDAVGLALELNKTIVDDRAINVERYIVRKLGAKDARDRAAAVEKQKNTGAKKRLDGKAKKEKSNKPNAEKAEEDKPKKKGEFRGVKVEGLKKNKDKKKKAPTHLQKLAKKIAPKTTA